MYCLQSPQQDSESTVAKKVLDALDNSTKGYFQEIIASKVQFQKMWGTWPPPPHPTPLLSVRGSGKPAILLY